MAGATEHARIEPLGGGVALDALYTPGASAAAVVAPPHPLYGGRMDNPVVTTICAGLARANVAALRFDWRGVGRSEGVATGDLRAASTDYAGALACLVGRHAGPYLGAGYSFGAATALAVAAQDPRLEQLVLVSPPVAMMPLDRFAGFERDVLVVVGDEDDIAPLDLVRAFVAALPRGRLEVVDGADHFFSFGGLDRVERLVADRLAPR